MASTSFDERTIRQWYVPVYLAIACFAIAGAFALARISQLAAGVRARGANSARTPGFIARIAWMSAILFGFLPPYLLATLTLQWLDSIPRGGQQLGFRLLVPRFTLEESIVLAIVAACFLLTPLGLIATGIGNDGIEH